MIKKNPCSNKIINTILKEKKNVNKLSFNYSITHNNYLIILIKKIVFFFSLTNYINLQYDD